MARLKFYIDPTVAIPGDGSEATPFQTANAAPWQPGADFLFKRGTTHRGEVMPKVAGTIGARMSIGAYGVGPRPILDGTGSKRGSLFLHRMAYIDISGIETIGSAGGSSSGIHLLDSFDISVDDVYAHNSRQGIRIDNATNADKSGFRITNSIIEDTQNVGLAIACGTLRGGTLHNIRIDNVQLYRVATAEGGTGVSVNTRLPTNQPYDPDFVAYDVKISRLLLDGAGPGYGLLLKYVTGGYCKDSEIMNVALQNSAETHTYWMGGCRRFDTICNKIHHNGCWEGADSGSGVAIFADQGSFSDVDGGHGSQHCRIIGNEIHHQSFAPNDSATPSAGISVYRSQDQTITGNVIYNCRHGISIRGHGTMNTNRTLIAGNTMVDIERSAISVANHAANTTIANNVILRAGVGIFEETGDAAAVNVVRDYNTVHASTRHNFATGSFKAFSNGNEKAAPPSANDLELDPKLDANFRIGPDSPCYGSGHYVERSRDIKGKRHRSNPPDRGAKQAFTEET